MHAEIPFIDMCKTQKGAGVCLFLKHVPEDGSGKKNPDYRSVLDNDRDGLLQVLQVPPS